MNLNHSIVSISPLLNFGAMLNHLAEGQKRAIELKADYLSDCAMRYHAQIDKGLDTNGIAHINLVGEVCECDPVFALWFGIAVPSIIGEHIRKYEEMPECREIHLHVNSGGGTISTVPELADTIFNCKKPTTAIITESCCSAAYWIASQCKRIVATRGATIGALGVYVAITDESEAYANHGVKVHLISTAELKGAGESGTPLTEAQRDFLQSFINRSGELFVADIKRARPSFDSSLFSGAFWHAEDALDNGLIDDVLI